MSTVTVNQPAVCNVTAKVLSEHVIAPQIVILNDSESATLDPILGTDVSQTVKVIYLGNGVGGDEATITANGANPNNTYVSNGQPIPDHIVGVPGVAASTQLTLGTFGESYNLIAMSTDQHTLPNGSLTNPTSSNPQPWLWVPM